MNWKNSPARERWIINSTRPSLIYSQVILIAVHVILLFFFNMAKSREFSAQDRSLEKSEYSSPETRSIEVDKDGYGSNENHVFAEERTAIHWRSIYEKASYEGAHRFDPSYTWTAQEERKLLRKVCTITIGNGCKF